ncbi:MAG: hypothetical protein OXU81_11620 [Gammaproteobacteria bacterium]|nr:hypothetical protein [Gammaproteobacteria bacterium]
MARPDPIPFDTHRFVKRLTNEGMPAGQAEALADEQISLLNSHLVTKQDISHLATRDDVAKCATNDELTATKEELAATNEGVIRLERRVNDVAEDVAVLKSDLRTLKWVVAGVGFGMLTVMVGVSSLVIRMFWSV